MAQANRSAERNRKTVVIPAPDGREVGRLRLAPRALIAAADAPAASKRMFDVFNEAGLPPTDEALTRQFECLRRITGAAQASQSAER